MGYEQAARAMVLAESTIVELTWHHRDRPGPTGRTGKDEKGRRVTLPDRATPPPQDRRAAGAGSLVPPSLEVHEDLLAVVRGIGSAMFLTSDRIIVARDGYERRPRSGVQSFLHERTGRVRIERGSAGSGRIVVWSTGEVEAASMFFEARARDRADELVTRASAQIARARRRAATTDGVATLASPVARGKSDGSAGTPRRGV